MIEFTPRPALPSEDVAGHLDLAGYSLTAPLAALAETRTGASAIRAFFRHYTDNTFASSRRATAAEIEQLGDVLSFTGDLLSSFDIPAGRTLHELSVESAAGMEHGVLGRSSPIGRTIEVSESFLARALSTDPADDRARLAARGTLVHEVVHSLGHVRIGGRTGEDYTAAHCTAAGLRLRAGPAEHFRILEEYAASRAQALYYAAHGAPEEVHVKHLTLAVDPTEGIDRHRLESLSAAVAPFLDIPRPLGGDSTACTIAVPAVSAEVHTSPYGIIRAAMYGAAQSLGTGGVAAFDRLIFRAQALGEYRELLLPLTEELSPLWTRTLGAIQLNRHDPAPYVLTAALGVAAGRPDAHLNGNLLRLYEAAVADRARVQRASIARLLQGG